MTYDEELLCRPWNRDVFVALKNAEIRFDEAVFLDRRVEFHSDVEWLPEVLISRLLFFYDPLYEPKIERRLNVGEGRIGGFGRAAPPRLLP